jgi:hypothetical protein
VQWQPLSYREYLVQAQGAKHAADLLQGSTGGFYQSAGDPTVVAASTMIRAATAERLIHQHGVRVTAADVQQAYQAQLLQIGNAEQVTAMIQRLYGWTPDQFKTFVIRPAVVQDKLQEFYAFDPASSATASRQATSVLQIVKTSADSFESLAKKYSEDVYAVKGGDLGFVKPGELAKEIEDAAFSQDVNTVSDIIHTKYGFHIIKPIERKTVDGVDQVHLLQITVLTPSADDKISTTLQSTRVTLFTPHLVWDTKKHAVVPR